MIFVELYAGLAAVTLHLCGAKPPVSRIGAKTGYAAAIATELHLAPLTSQDRVLLVEKDPQVAEVLRTLFDRRRRDAAAAYVEAHQALDAQTAWRAAATHEGPGAWLLWTAGARGGIGGFKGAHVHRPRVDGFIPGRAALARRLREFPGAPCPVEVLCGLAGALPAEGGRTVYMDPAYEGRQGYEGGKDGDAAPAVIAQRWAAAGARVGVSEAHPLLLPGARHVDLTARREGQTRRSLTRDTREWLTVLNG